MLSILVKSIKTLLSRKKGGPSVNLDTFMATPEHVRELYDHYGTDADVCVGERMMTFFPFTN